MGEQIAVKCYDAGILRREDVPAPSKFPHRFPITRLGPKREYKKLLEGFWSHDIDAEKFIDGLGDIQAEKNVPHCSILLKQAAECRLLFWGLVPSLAAFEFDGFYLQ